MRARVCNALVKQAKGMPISPNDAYLLGMFSTLNYLIDAPMEEILADLPITQEVKDALLYRSGQCGDLYDLVLAYERADWKVIGDLADSLGIPVNLLTNIYFQCLSDVDNIWRSIMETSEGVAAAQEVKE